MEDEIEMVGEDYGKDNCTLLLTLREFDKFDANIWFDLIWTVHLSNA